MGNFITHPNQTKIRFIHNKGHGGPPRGNSKIKRNLTIYVNLLCGNNTFLIVHQWMMRICTCLLALCCAAPYAYTPNCYDKLKWRPPRSHSYLIIIKNYVEYIIAHARTIFEQQNSYPPPYTTAHTLFCWRVFIITKDGRRIMLRYTRQRHVSYISENCSLYVLLLYVYIHNIYVHEFIV